MRCQPLHWIADLKVFSAAADCVDADFVLYFGDRSALATPSAYSSLRALCPTAKILGCSTGTVVEGDNLHDAVATGVAVTLDQTTTKLALVALKGQSSFDAGRELAAQLAGPHLAAVVVLSDGLNVNGSALIAGAQSVLGSNVPLGGGLAGDGAAFEHTLVGADGPPEERVVAALGFYGEKLQVGLGAAHGWDYFGPTRRVTRAEGAVLFEMDGKPALDLYERYLGEEAAGLPASALLYPLLITNPADPTDQVVRTVLAVDHEKRTMTFAGDIPEGWSARLMRGNFDNLTDGAASAAKRAATQLGDGEGLALLVSCVGRRLLMGQRAGDEIEAASEVLAPHFVRTGFYSYGEIATQGVEGHCGLHNQTMTIMTLREAA